MIKVLVVDDHPIFRSGAAAAIAAEPDLEVVGEAASTDEAIEATRQFKPDIVLTDIRLDGDTNGIELARRVKEAHDDVGIVVLTNYSNEPYIRAMMEIGVGGYVMKDTPPRDVIEAIRMVMEGRTVFSSSVTETLVRGYLSPAPSVQTDGSDEFTERERALLGLLAQGVSNADMAKRLSVSVRQSQAHLTSIYAKLGVRSKSEAIGEAARRGLVIVDE